MRKFGKLGGVYKVKTFGTTHNIEVTTRLKDMGIVDVWTSISKSTRTAGKYDEE